MTAKAAVLATRSTPVVAGFIGDPVVGGFVASLSHTHMVAPRGPERLSRRQ
jgi:hypothetical protein